MGGGGGGGAGIQEEIACVRDGGQSGFQVTEMIEGFFGYLKQFENSWKCQCSGTTR